MLDDPSHRHGGKRIAEDLSGKAKYLNTVLLLYVKLLTMLSLHLIATALLSML
jgi:hypothetical protein